MRDLSILIPARNEEFLVRTIEDILSNIEADTEILVGLDGQWPEPGIPDNDRVRLLYYPESIGQRAMTNQLCRLSSAKYVMKVDAHCAFDKGFDRIMLEGFKETGDNVTMAPLMRNLHVFDWVCPDGHRRYQGNSGVCEECGKPTEKDIVWIAKTNPQSFSYRFDRDLHFQYWGEYKKKQVGDLVESMSLQGSCFMMTRDKYWELDICDEGHGSWGQQGTEVACKTWLSGMRVIINKKTWYAHLFRTKGGDFGFPYPNPHIGKAREYSKKLWLDDNWPKAKYKLDWLIKKFDPPDWVEKEPTKGIIYYTDNQLDPKIMEACQQQLLKSGLPITSASLKKMDFGTKNIRFPSLRRGHFAMFKQMLGALENSPADMIFFCEHDVLYHPSHFDFTPAAKDVFYFNTNVWKVDQSTGKALKVDRCEQLSGMCVWKETALDFVREKMKQIETEGFDRHYEPRGKRENWSSKEPLVDIRHDGNMTPNRWSKDRFRNQENTKGWTEGECPDWAKGIFTNTIQK